MISKVFNIFNLIEYPVTKILYYPYNIKNKISKKINVPILAYHNICDPPENCEYPPYYVSILLFKKQMEFLYENGYSVISLEDFLLYSEGKKAINKNSVIITFDDGYKNIYEYAYPILKKYNFPATIFIVAGFIGNSEPFPWLKLNNNCNIKEWLPLSWEETLEMRQNVMSFGSHSMTHNQLSKLSEKEIVNEIKDSKLIIQSKLGSISLFSYPFSCSKNFKNTDTLITIINILKENRFSAACSTMIGTNSKNCDFYLLKRIQINDKDLIFKFHAKIIGAYNWVRFPQALFGKYL